MEEAGSELFTIYDSLSTVRPSHLFDRWPGRRETGRSAALAVKPRRMEKESQHRRAALVFVYNADSGVFNTLADAAHKIFSPRTYQCNLCALTHSAIGMRKEWKRFLEGLDSPLEFLHADELKARYGVAGVALPAIFKKDGETVEVLFGADSINACRTMDDLKRLILSGSV